MCKTVRKRPSSLGARRNSVCGVTLAKWRAALSSFGISPFFYIGKRRLALKRDDIDALVNKTTSWRHPVLPNNLPHACTHHNYTIDCVVRWSARKADRMLSECVRAELVYDH